MDKKRPRRPRFNAAEITEDAKAELSRVAKTLKSVRQIMLRGYAGGDDPIDDRKVALARTLSVRAYLIDVGLKSRIEIGNYKHLPAGSTVEYVEIVISSN